MPRSALAVVLALALTTPALAQPAAGARKLLYPPPGTEVPAVLRPHIERIIAAEQKKPDPAAAKFDGAYLRVVSRKYALDKDSKPNGWLGARPVVFLTVPHAAYGPDGVSVLSALGYDPEDIIKSKGDEKVAIVFAFPDTVRPADPKADAFPDDWDRRVFPSTWDNLFALTDRFSADKGRFVVNAEDTFLPGKFQFRSEKEAAFAAVYPAEGKARIQKTDYAGLRDTGGADWKYRALAQRLLGASEHFRGDGRTKLTVVGENESRVGFPEFLAPNAALQDLPAIAVVSLGTLQVNDKRPGQ